MQYCKFNPYDECFGGCDGCKENENLYCECCGEVIECTSYITLYGDAICNECIFANAETDDLIGFARKYSNEYLDFLTKECKDFELQEIPIKKELYL